MTSDPHDRKRILIADDDAFYRDMAAAQLAEAGYDPVTVADGPLALDRLADGSFDIAMVDLTMPGMDGFEVVRQLRASPATRHLPIIVVTGHDDPQSVEAAFQLGATSFVAKPVNWALFVHTVEFVLRASRNEGRLRESTYAIEVLSRLKSNLMSMLANEFRAPIRTAFGFAELIRQQAVGPIGAPAYLEYAADICQAVEQLNTQVLRMLHLGRALSDQMALEEGDTPLVALLEECIGATSDAARRKRIALASDLRLDPAIQCRCDRALLSQALKSLFENSVRFAPGGSHLQITAWIAAGGSLEMTLALDTASPTMDVEEPTPPASYTSRMGQPRDVGLTIAKLLVEAHHGVLDASGLGSAGVIARLTVPAARLWMHQGAASAGGPREAAA